MMKVDRVIMAAIAVALWAIVGMKLLEPGTVVATSPQPVDIVAVSGRAIYDGAIPIKGK